MSKLSNLLSIIKSTIEKTRDKANDAADWVLLAGKNIFQDKEDARKQVLDAFHEAIADGEVTLSELSAIQELQEALDLTDEDYYRLKMEAFQETIKRVMADQIVTDEELKFIESVQDGLNLSEEQLRRLKSDLSSLKKMHSK